ncbi:CD1107 family mobile element protein [Enterococcus faecium]|uniref:CD1107 family mobile element protein n=1 Tax=Enterococcus faecium TaxID=1352 RepID=UPI0030C8B65A
MKNKTRRISRILPALLAVMLCVTAFPVTALAGGNDPAPAPLPEATTEPATGGLEPETDETGTATDGTETEAEKDTGPLTGKDITDLFSALFGSKVSIAATDDGIQITTGTDKKEPEQTGTVTTNGGRLNVRTGAGLDKTAFTQLPNGTTVEVVGTDGDWIKILLPERIGYVHSDYMTVSEKEVAATGEGGFSLSIDPEEIASLLELFNGRGASAALSPDGNLSLIDDIGSAAKNGKQFITVETKNGNVFYLIIDRDDEGKETVHFLNQVDEADLLTLMEDGETVTPAAVCSCTTKCKAGAVNTNCPVCKTNLTECSGPEPQEPQPEEPEAPEEEPKGGAGGLIVFLLVALAGGGAALYYFKFKKPKAETTGSDDLGEYDFGEDEDLEDEEPETEFDPEADFVSEQEDEE